MKRFWPWRFFLKPHDFSLYRNDKNSQPVWLLPSAPRSVVFYDHACPICRAEMHRLKRRDRHQRLRLVDTSHPRFRAAVWGLNQRDLEAALHVLTERRIWLVGMAAIRHVYGQVGRGWLMAPSGWPWLSRLADAAYGRFAANRIRISRWLFPGTACNRNGCAPFHSPKAGRTSS
jgi:predicted DCC family thiol-disulfide oxidoreductase YuxK